MNPTGRERVLAAIRFEPPTRVPTWTPGYDAGFVLRWRQFKGVGADVDPLDYDRNDTAILIGDEALCDALFDRVTDHFEQMALETLKRTQTYETGLFMGRLPWRRESAARQPVATL